MLTNGVIESLQSLKTSRTDDLLLCITLTHAIQQLKELQETANRLHIENRNLRDILRNIQINDRRKD